MRVKPNLARERWLAIIEPIAPMLFKTLTSQFSQIAITVACDHYAITKTKSALKTFIESADADSLKELANIEQYIVAELGKVGITERMFDRDDLGKPDKAAFGSLLITLAILATVGFFSILIVLLLYDIPEANKDPLLILLGTLGSGWMMVLSYFFGSSVSQHRPSSFSRRDDFTPQPPAEPSLSEGDINNIVERSIEKNIERKLQTNGNKNITAA